MIKQLVVTLNVIGVFILSWFFSGNVDISQSLPQQANVNEAFTVEITINKSDLEGFAKYQVVLPAGLSATPGETKGATFSFKDQKVKFIWMALPTDETITISYKVTADETGEYTIGGKFAYIYNNERSEKEVTPQTITISAGELLTENTPPAEVPAQEEEETTTENTSTSTSGNDTNDNTETETATTNATEQPANENNVENNNEPATVSISNVSVNQSVLPQPDNSFIVNVTIEKGNMLGFAKYQADIPNGFKAENIESAGASFAFKNQKAKFIWMALPNESTFKISYKLVPIGAPSGNYTVNSTFSYVENDETRTKSIPTASFNYTSDDTFVSNLKEDNPELPSGNETSATQEIEPTTTNNYTASTNTNDNTSVADNNPAARNVKYKVQVGAGHQIIPMNYFRKKYNLTDKVTLELHEGWRKYVIGSYSVYKEARDKRNQVWSNNQITDAFVTAYNGSTRITVQEALMITNQQWYK